MYKSMSESGGILSKSDNLSEVSSSSSMDLSDKLQITVSSARAHAAYYILARVGIETEGITKIHGRIHEANLLGFEVFIIPMYHPAAALYNAKYKDELDKYFQLLKLRLERRG